ncbi:tyrosine recombinase XerC [Variovorax ginsengisoli]|uniref:Tyrosine recombinase XerC n=1 Tax=Variovorax ginsengisoli TaxID=363844 RepID=A0ABT9SCW6_9BURK|nr:tyrosine recombinase XerC [Variovorax ginsengisoli]MDP9901683.1 integrase/recombinase XerC [Variovorax ginsengisoli]
MNDAPAIDPLPAADPLIDRYLAHVRVERRLAARTVDLYAIHLKTLCEKAAESGLPLARVQTAHVRRWMTQLHSAGREPRGIALVLSCWRSFYRWMGHERLVEANPVQDVRAPKAGRPLPKALAVDDAVRLAELHDANADPWAEARDRAIVELLYGCGLRVSELVGLDLVASKDARGWIDLDAGDAHVLGKGGKRRSVPVGSKAAEALRAWLAVRDDCAALPAARLRDPEGAVALFLGRNGNRFSAHSIWKQLKARSAKAGLNASVHPHMLRHSFASHVLQSSSDLRGVQELLGHANITTTQVYTRLDFQHLAKAYDAAHPRAQAKKDK